MKKFIAIIGTTKEITQSNYPSLIGFFLNQPLGIRFQPNVFVFEFVAGVEVAHDAIRKLLGNGDELWVFELSGGCWTIDRLRDIGGARDAQIRKFLGVVDTKLN